MSMSSILSALLPMLVAVIAGAAVPFQAASNAALGRALGHPLWATVSSLIVSVLVAVPVMLLLRVPAPSLGSALQGPAWWWLGGLAGVAYVTAALVLTPKLGAASFIIGVVAGQMLAALLIDQHGLMGLAPRPASMSRLVGIAMILLGLLVVQLGPLAEAATSANSTASRA